MKIAELVKTYKLLNDPGAPDWSVKFVGAIAIATMLFAGAGAIVAGKDAAPGSPAAAAALAPQESAAEPAGEEPASCEAADLAADAALAADCAPRTETPQLP